MRQVLLSICFLAILLYVFAPNSFSSFQAQMKETLSKFESDNMTPVFVSTDEEPQKEKTTSESNKQIHNAEFLYHIDGDTIAVLFEGKQESVRFLMMNTPETKNVEVPEPYGTEASDFTKNFFTNAKTVQLEFDVQKRDPYGRLLAYVYYNDIMINKELLQNGLAEVTIYHPNNKYENEFYHLQNYAIEQKLGMWSQN